MREEVQLYLGGTEVQFSEPPEILFSYIRTDYTDPTVLRNSYSKTLTIEGTPNNNQIFNSIYHLDKISNYGTFNPAKRMEFKLFSNGDILEQGYAKLDKINKNGKNISYDITLYGGLGEFLYNLSYDQTEEGSDTSRGGGEDRRLSSLVFYDETEPNKEFDFDITKETVAEAWEALEKGTGATKWQYINFAPAYNGYPKDFDADKVIINTQNSTVPLIHNNNGSTGSTKGFPTDITDGDTTYRTYNNYALGELPKEMTEWEMRDLRSYLQRPVMSMKGFMQAVANPVNNGGYSVDLDNRFFNSNNPYYEKAWVTLPQLKKDETELGQSAKTEVANNILTLSSEMGVSYDKKYYLQGLQPGATYQGLELSFQFSADVANMPDQIMTTAMDYNAGGLFAEDAGYYSSIFVQLVGEDENGNPIAGSPIYNFTTPYGDEQGVKIFFGNQWEGPQNHYCGRDFFGTAYTPDIVTSDEVVKGRFVRTSGNHYVWRNINGNVATVTAKLDDRFEYSRVYLRVTKVFRWRDLLDGHPMLNRWEVQIFSGVYDTEEKRRNILVGWVPDPSWISDGTKLSANTAVTQMQIVGSQAKYTVVSDVVRSGDHISKGNLLNFDGTPCDYLLSYCKLFNLYLSKDPYEKKIYIRTRDTFYNGGTIDLDKFIDRSKEIKVSPLAMESRWYDFAYPEDEMCGAAEDYDFNYGVEYGKNKVQTTYEFDSAAKNLFEDNIYQNGVQVQESSKYYTLRTIYQDGRTPGGGGYKTVPTYLYNSIEYKLFGENPTDTLSSCSILPPSGFTQTGYTAPDGKEDWLPKLQLNNGNDPIDGTNVLCFYGGFKTSPSFKPSTQFEAQQVIYYLTDDIEEMYVLNGETPCWLWTKGEYNGNQRIAKGMTKLPVFSRMLYNDNEDKIDYTWDFGRVRNTYVPVKSYNDKSTIFERWWSNYIADIYDANTRVVEAYVKMEGKVVGDWLRAFYWWDNCYWVLTEINDYNITSYATTRCKFVKVNDIANYTNGTTPPPAGTPTATLVPEKYMISATGETITARVVTSDGGAWHIEYPSYVHPSQVAGTGDTQITLRFDSNPNPDGRDFDVRAYRTIGTSTHFWQEGSESVDKQLSLSNKTFVLGGGTGTFGTIVKYKNRGSDTVTVTTTADWFEISTPLSWDGDSGQIFFRITGTNDTEEVISSTVTFTAVNDPSLTETMFIDWLPRQLHFGGNGGSKSLTLLNNGLQVTARNGYWASFTTTEHTITFNAPPNLDVAQRSELDSVSYMNSGATNGTMAGGFIRLVQDGGGGSLVVSPSSITADYTGGDKIMTVNATGNWSATSKPDWVTLSQSTGSAGQSTVIVTFAENTSDSARTGTITITDGTRTVTANLSQAKRNTQGALTVSPDNLYFDYTGNTKYINIGSLAENWSMVSKPEWIVLSQSSGVVGYSMVSVTAPENTGVTTKTGEIIFTDGINTVSVLATQSTSSTTKTLTLSPSIIYVENSGGTPIIHLDYGNRNGDDVTITSSESWVHPTYVQWTGDTGNVVLNVDNYGVNLERTATITATSILDPTLTATMTVRQKALPYIDLNPVFVEFVNTGGTATITLQSNTDWIIDIDNDN